MTRAVVAEELGVEPARVNKWVADGAPCAIRGSVGHQAWYDLEAMRAWRDARTAVATMTGATTAGEAGLAVAEESAKLKRAQRLKLELERAVKLGELLPAEAVVAQGQAVLVALKARLMSLPRQAVHRGLIERSQEQGMHALILETLRDLAQWHVGEEAIPVEDEPEAVVEEA